MERNYKITIPKPCHENWNAMSPDDNGRFCGACSKSVVDFTNMKSTEVQEYFIQNQGQKICGRFKNEQLDTIVIQIPSAVLFSQVNFHKIFMLALLVSMGTSLFSCKNNNGEKQKIDSVEVVNTIQHTTMGIPLPPKQLLKLSNSNKIDPDTLSIKMKFIKGIKIISANATMGYIVTVPSDSLVISKNNDILLPTKSLDSTSIEKK